MKTYKEFLLEVKYREVDHKRIGDEEHNELPYQSGIIKKYPSEYDHVHPAIKDAIHRFASNPNDWHEALSKSTIEPIKRGTVVHNTELGLDEPKGRRYNAKKKRVGKLLDTGIDRPIVLRHKDKETGIHHHYLVAGNTRATSVGYGVEAHHIDI